MNGLIIIEKVIAKHNNYDIFNKYNKKILNTTYLILTSLFTTLLNYIIA